VTAACWSPPKLVPLGITRISTDPDESFLTSSAKCLAVTPTDESIGSGIDKVMRAVLLVDASEAEELDDAPELAFDAEDGGGLLADEVEPHAASAAAATTASNDVGIKLRRPIMLSCLLICKCAIRAYVSALET
jgi:hypothetical protein